MTDTKTVRLITGAEVPLGSLFMYVPRTAQLLKSHYDDLMVIRYAASLKEETFCFEDRQNKLLAERNMLVMHDRLHPDAKAVIVATVAAEKNGGIMTAQNPLPEDHELYQVVGKLIEEALQ